MQDSNSVLNEVTNGEYKYGFVTDIDTEVIHRGLDEETVRIISAKKHEPDWLLEFRLRAFRYWQTLEMPNWALLKIPPLIIRISFIMRLRLRKTDRKIWKK